MYWKRPTVAVSVLALTALAACGGGSSDDETSPGDTGDTPGATGSEFVEGGTAGTNQDPEAQAPAPPIEGAVQGGDVTMTSIAGLPTMDPTEAYYVHTAAILSGLVVRSLTQYQYRDGEMWLVPDLATDLGTPNEDFTEWTFTLRDGIKYEDGTPVTPEDMKFGLLRSFDRDAFPDGAAYSNEYFLNGDKYKGPYTDPKGDCDCVEINGMDITIKMARPFPDMPYWGAFPAISPIPEAAADPQKYRLHPLATGPYKFGDFKPGDSLELVRNDQWDEATDPARHAYPDSYSMDFNTQSATTDQTILADQGEGRSTMTLDNVLAPDLQKAKDSGNLVTGGQPCTFFWYPDLRKPEWQDINVRKALGYAYAYADAWLAGGEIVGVTRIPGTTIQPPGIPSRPDPLYDVLGNKGLEGDPAKAKELLTKADALGTEVKFLYITSDPTSVDAKNQNVKSLTESGFTPKPVAVADSTAAAEMRADPDAPLNMRSGGWCSDWPSGASWLPPVFQTGQGANYGYFSEKAVDKKIREIQSSPLEEQAGLWAELDQEIMETYYPAVITGYSGVAMIHGSDILGMNNDDVFGQPTWKDIAVTNS